MERIPIAELAPSLPSLDTKVIKAVVTLLWPYSSSTRQCALLLADPDFRLRRRRGQVRVRFSGPAGRALGNSGIGIGDEVILALQGAQYINDVGDVRTPGKSVEWELSFQQRLVTQIFRDGQGLVRLDIDHPTPSPEPDSPITSLSRAEPQTITPVVQRNSAQSTPELWSSPAFLKRTRISDGSYFESGYDPLSFMDGSDNIFEANGRKRRRKSYKNWRVWTYSAITPSPGKGDDRSTEEEKEGSISPDERAVSSSAEPLQSPISASKDLTIHSEADLPLIKSREKEPNKRELIQNSNDIEMTDPITEPIPVGAGTEEVLNPPERPIVSESEFQLEVTGEIVEDDELHPEPEIYQPYIEVEHFEGDTRPNTEDDEAEIHERDANQLSATEIDSEEEVSELSEEKLEQPNQVEESDTESAPPPEVVVILDSTEDSVNESMKFEGRGKGKENDDYEMRRRERSGTQDGPIVLDQAPEVMMPPPHLPYLQTDFISTTLPKVQTPIGNAPLTPVIHPLESSTLPLPSPFPGERDAVATSYFGHSTNIQPTIQALATDTSTEGSVDDVEQHTVESSMHHGMGTPKMNTRHGMHSTAFNEIRFPFGLDGSMFSREKVQPESTVTMDIPAAESVVNEDRQDTKDINKTELYPDLPAIKEEKPHLEPAEQIPAEEICAEINVDQESSARSLQQKGPIIIDLSSDEESEPVGNEEEDGEEEDETEDRVEEAEESEEEDEMEDEVEETEESEEEDETEDEGEETEESEEDGPYHNPILHRSRWIPPEDRYMYNRSSSQHEVSADSSNTTSQESDGYSEQNETLGISRLAEAPEDSNEQEIRDVQETNVQAAMESSSPKPLKEYTQEEPAPEKRSMASPVQRLTQIIDLGDGESDEDEAMADQQKLIDSSVIAEETVVGEPTDGQQENLLEDHLKHIEMHLHRPDRNNKHTTEDNTIIDPENPPATPPESVKRPITPLEKRLSPTIPAMNTRSKTYTSAAKRKQVGRSLRCRTQTSTPNKRTKPPTKSHGQHTTLHRPTPSPISTLSRTPSVEIDMSAFEPIDFPSGDTRGAPATQTSASQFANVSFVKDSEDESLRSRSSISTVQYPDGIETVRMETYDYPSQAEELMTQIHVSDSLYPQLPATSQDDVEMTSRFDEEELPEVSSQSRGTIDSKIPDQLSQPPSIERDFSAYKPQSSPEADAVNLSQGVGSSPPAETFSKADALAETDSTKPDTMPSEVTYPPLPIALEVPSSPPTQFDFNQQDFSINHQSLTHGNLPMTPDPSQQQALESQETYKPVQTENALPLTPQLTQRTSTDLPPNSSFQSAMSPEAALTISFAERQPHTKKKQGQTPQTRLSDVPEALSAWFAPRSSLAAASDSEISASSQEESESVVSGEDIEGLASPTANGHGHGVGLTHAKHAAKVTEPPSQGLRTPLSFYTPLASISPFLNLPSQSPDSTLDVLALVTRDATPAARAKAGLRDYHTVFSITDLSTYPEQIQVQVFRPWKLAIPTAEAGDVVLLRGFGVRSREGRAGLLSTEESAWCVWRFGMPVWGMKRGEFGELETREEVKGPPVELGREERMEVERLRGWWESTVEIEMEERNGVKKSEGVANGGNEGGATETSV